MRQRVESLPGFDPATRRDNRPQRARVDNPASERKHRVAFRFYAGGIARSISCAADWRGRSRAPAGSDPLKKSRIRDALPGSGPDRQGEKSLRAFTSPLSEVADS